MEEIKYPDECKKVLGHGFVRLVDVMGNDSSIVQAARVSYGQGTKTFSDDVGLIRYLLRMRHTTPFEMVEFKFHVRLPIFVARQWIRHRTWSFNEVSGRYSEMPDLFHVPEPDRITKQSTSNKQGGSDEVMDNPEREVHLFQCDVQESYSDYKARIDLGMRRELARINLPISLYTEWYCKVDLHNLFHFLRLRLDSHAQYEIRVYAEAMAEYVKQAVPIAYQAFEDYSLNSINFSALEILALRNIVESSGKYINLDFQYLKNKRENQEFVNKLKRIIES